MRVERMSRHKVTCMRSRAFEIDGKSKVAAPRDHVRSNAATIRLHSRSHVHGSTACAEPLTYRNGPTLTLWTIGNGCGIPGETQRRGMVIRFSCRRAHKNTREDIWKENDLLPAFERQHQESATAGTGGREKLANRQLMPCGI